MNIAVHAFRPFERAGIEQSIVSRFESSVARWPGRVALEGAGCSLTYAELSHASSRLAADIVARLGPASRPVGLLMAQGVAAVVATLAILKAGKFYLPLEPAWTDEQMQAVVAGAGIALVLTDREFTRRAASVAPQSDVVESGHVEPAEGAGHPHAWLSLAAVRSASIDPAYVYFTSGTTGRPKGIADCHRNVLHNVMRYTNALRIVPTDRLSLIQSCGFSAVVSSLFSALSNGACVCPLDLRGTTPAGLADWVEAQRISIFHSVPAIFRGIAQGQRRFDRVRIVRLEGDRAQRLDFELFDRAFGPASLLAIGLGTTETGLVCQYRFQHGDRMPDAVSPIGYPLQDMSVSIADESGRPLPAGSAGEIVVTSAYLATGYWNDPARTATAFTASAADEAVRSYRTGDLGRMRHDGCLEYLGRLDTRVKLRGQTVELADVEAALAALDSVSECAVIAAPATGSTGSTGSTSSISSTNSTNSTEARLIAYVVPRAGGRPSASELRAALAGKLSSHMIPARYVLLDALPLNANRKVDRAALPFPGVDRPALASRYVPPESVLQRQLVQIWQDVLQVRPIGIDDDFFDLGGDSLLVVAMMDRVAADVRRSLPLAALMEATTIARLAQALQDGAPRQSPSVVTLTATGSRAPLFFLHGDYASGGFYCVRLARLLGDEQPFHVLAPLGLDGQPMPDSYQAMAQQHLQAIRSICPNGPYVLGGHCNGGLIAYEIARLMRAQDQEVALVLMTAAWPLALRHRRLKLRVNRLAGWLGLGSEFERSLFRRLYAFPASGHGLSARQRMANVMRKAWRFARDPGGAASVAALARSDPVWQGYQRLDDDYRPGGYGGRAVVLWAADDPPLSDADRQIWRAIAPRLTVQPVPGDHASLLVDHLGALAAALGPLLRTVPR